MLEKLRIEFTRSRPRHSNDNGLAKTKNGAVVRKLFRYMHIPQHHASRLTAVLVGLDRQVQLPAMTLECGSGDLHAFQA
jgi:hypothetical protein